MTTTPTTNYGFLKITAGTEIDIWATPYNSTMDAIDTQIKNRQNEAAAALPKSGGTMTGKEIFAAGVTGAASFTIPSGVAPTSPVEGDMWKTSTNLLIRLNGISQNVLTDGNKVNTPASVAGSAGLNVPHGTAPTAPVNGDIWSTTANFFGRLNGATITFATTTYVDAADALKAPLASPALTGTPTAPTASGGTNNTQIATTAFVAAAVAAGGGSVAAASDIWTGTDNAKIVTSKAAADANLEQTLTDGATVTVNFAAGINFALNPIAGNRTLAASGLSAGLIGRSGYIKVVQDGTGSRTLDMSGATWKNINQENLILSTGAGQIDYLFYTIISSSTVLMSIARNVG